MITVNNSIAYAQVIKFVILCQMKRGAVLAYANDATFFVHHTIGSLFNFIFAIYILDTSDVYYKFITHNTKNGHPTN